MKQQGDTTAGEDKRRDQRNFTVATMARSDVEPKLKVGKAGRGERG